MVGTAKSSRVDGVPAWQLYGKGGARSLVVGRCAEVPGCLGQEGQRRDGIPCVVHRRVHLTIACNGGNSDAGEGGRGKGGEGKGV